MATPYPRSFGRLLSLLILICPIFSPFVVSASSPPAISPAAGTELICHTDNSAECYPKVFSATEEFQIVHDDQDLPPGLHVQLDVQTGRKQAKLYNPDEENPALAGLPVNQEVIVVDPEPPHDGEPSIPAGAPAYEPVGMVKAPREKNEDFSQALRTVKESAQSQQSAGSSALDEALQLLDDLSHDLYYGLQIAEDAGAVQSLFCLLFEGDGTGVGSRPIAERADFLASSVLSAAVGNNARALGAIEKSWDAITEQACKAGSRSIKHELFHRLAPTSEPGTGGEAEEADVTRLYLAVVSGLLKSPKIRAEFLDNDGMQGFLQILLRDGGVWASRKAKVASIISDTFLDEDFGATLGLWPRKPQVYATSYAESGSRKISQSPEAPDWSKHLLSLVEGAQVPGSRSDTPEHNEL
ncbi:hypothetical protein F4802DRAFT_607547 [Xylaria palmicola]|nr:hypothetical protein F4802DRAFT_607547 [Xylaria palmicola]